MLLLPPPDKTITITISGRVGIGKTNLARQLFRFLKKEGHIPVEVRDISETQEQDIVNELTPFTAPIGPRLFILKVETHHYAERNK